MSKYDRLWDYIRETGSDCLRLSFGEIHEILGFPMDHSFLNCKKELLEYGYQVGRISMKQQTVEFQKSFK